jgi:signal transduction histidine kinase
LAVPRAAGSIHRLLRSSRFVTAWVDQVSMAEVLVRQQPFDVIVVDGGTPGLDPFQAARTLRTAMSQKDPGTPMLLVWDGPVRRARRRALRAGYDDVVSSPFDASDFCLRLANLARMAAARRAEAACVSPPAAAPPTSARRVEAVGSLVFGVVHDFNNILTVIGAYSQFLQTQVSPQHPMQTDIDEICRAVKRASTLTRHLLSFTRPDSFRPEPAVLDRVLREMDKMLRRMLGEDVELSLVLQAEETPVLIDVSQFERVMLNLAANARDAMPKGGRLTLTTGLVTRPVVQSQGGMGEVVGRTHVLVTVTDSGDGMSEDVRRRAFEPYFTTKSGEAGSGLGLATVKGIVEQFGGHIEVRSELGRGTSFQICFPATQQPESMPPRLSLVPPPIELGPARTILLAEDDASVREVTRRALEDRGLRVLVAPGPTEAILLSEAEKGPIDLLLSDVVMPGMSGIDLAHRLLADRGSMEVLFMSGARRREKFADTELPPGSTWLDKPVAIEKLVREVEFLLSRRPRAPGPAAANVSRRQPA